MMGSIKRPMFSIVQRVSSNSLLNVIRKRQNYTNLRASIIISLLALMSSGCSVLNGYEQTQERAESNGNTVQTNAYQITAQADRAYNAEDWTQSSTLYRDVVEAIPNDSYAWFRLGNSLAQLGLYSQAVDAYQTSLEADSTQFKAWFNLSTTHLLSAKVVTLNALRSIAVNDPSRAKVESRLDVLTALLN